MKSYKAVLTADIVNSTMMDSKDLNDLILLIRSELKKDKVLFEFYRGDSFHVLAETDQALTLALKLRMIARQFTNSAKNNAADIRIAIGLGKINEPVKTMAMGKGEAFLLSGRELDLINKSSTRLSIRCADAKIDAGMGGIAILVDMIVKDLSSKQAEVLIELLLGATQMEIAVKLKKSQSTVNKLAQAGNWAQLEKASQIYRKLALYIQD